MAEISKIKAGVDRAAKAWDEVKLTRGDHIDLKAYELAKLRNAMRIKPDGSNRRPIAIWLRWIVKRPRRAA